MINIKRHYKKFHRGVGIIEVMTAIAIAAIFFTAIYQLLIFSVRTTHNRTMETEGIYLAQEGMEAVRFIKSAGWSANILPLVNGTIYYPVISGSEWVLSTVNPGAINSVYTRRAVFSEVKRDVNDDINSLGTADPDTRKVTITVEWNETGGARNIAVETYISNFLAN